MAKSRVKPGVNDLMSQRPDIAAKWHPTKNSPLLPTDVARGQKKKVWWQCQEGHPFLASVSNMVFGMGCPVCAGKVVLAGVNDLATTHPEVASEWHPSRNASLMVTAASKGMRKKVWWQCAHGHEWEAAINNRALHNTGCPVCAGQKVISGDNDLATTHPAIAAQWHRTKNGSLTPDQVRRGSPVLVWWQCSHGHEWTSRIADRTRGSECPECSRLRLREGALPLSQSHPELAAQWDEQKNLPLSLIHVSAGSNRIAWWICSKDESHQWKASVANRATKNSGCPLCWSSKIVSQAEHDICALLESLGVEVEQSRRDLLGTKQELDIYLPDHAFAIEFNGLYWHSEATGKGRNYHKNKALAAKNAGITLYQMWEDDWRDNKEIILRGLAHRLGVTNQLRTVLPNLPKYYTQTIGARQTKIITLDYNQSAEFLTEHHIQGKATGTHYLGLMDSKERLRAVLVLKRTGKTGELSIERYATAGTVSGGFSKLLKHAEKTYQPKRWVTFADLSISDGGLYEKTGFTVERVLPPDYSYLVNGKRVHKFNYRLKRFRDDPTLQYEEGMTEAELAALNGLIRIWDTGKVRYVKEAS